MTATYDLTTTIGQVRLTIGDTVVATAHFTDEEITYFLTQYVSVNLAAAAALRAWAASLSREVSSESIGGYSYSKKETERMLSLADSLEEKENNSPACDWGEMDLVEGDDHDFSIPLD